MSSILVLAGGQEFQKGNENLDRYLLQQAGGATAEVLIVAGDKPDRATSLSNTGRKWFAELGATAVETVLLDNESAAGQQLAKAQLVYLTDGDLDLYLASLDNLEFWQSLRQAEMRGAIIAGSGAGAMILMEQVFQPANGQLYIGAGLLPGSLLIPHFNNAGRRWADKVRPQLPPDFRLIGLDDKVAIVGQGLSWQVYGRGWVTLYQQGQPAKYQGGQPFKFKVPGQ